MSAYLLLLTASLGLGAERFGGQAFYLGDPHVHSGASGDGGSTDLGVCEGTCGAMAEIAETARANGLDWMALTDHVNGSRTANARDFSLAFTTMLGAHDPEGGFVVLPGAELRIGTPDGDQGHKNLYFAASNSELAEMTIDDLRFDGAGADIESCDALWTWALELEHRWGDLMLLAHHPTRVGRMGTDWSCHRGELATHFSPAVEVYSRHGDGMACPTDHDALPEGCQEGSEAIAALDPEGHALRLSFIGGTDAHDTLPGNVCALDTEIPEHAYGGGLTVVVLDDDQLFDRDALFHAIQQGSTYATTGPMLPVVVDYIVGDRRLGGMGETLVVPHDQPLRVELRLPAQREHTLSVVVLVTPAGEEPMRAAGDGVYHAEIAAGALPTWVYPRVELDGSLWYDEPCRDGGADSLEQLWISPSYLTVGELDTGDPGDTGDTGPDDTSGDSTAPDSDPPGDSDQPGDSDPPGDSGGGSETSSCRSSCTQGGPAPAMFLALALLGLAMTARRERKGR